MFCSSNRLLNRNVKYTKLTSTYLFSDCSNLFQHSFICGELEVKPVRDLLLEYKAEVVEEEVVDEEVEVSCILLICT